MTLSVWVGCLPQALVNILKQKDIQRDPETLMNYLRPFRVIVSLLDKPEIGKQNYGQHRQLRT